MADMSLQILWTRYLNTGWMVFVGQHILSVVLSEASGDGSRGCAALFSGGPFRSVVALGLRIASAIRLCGGRHTEEQSSSRKGKCLHWRPPLPWRYLGVISRANLPVERTMSASFACLRNQLTSS